MTKFSTIVIFMLISFAPKSEVIAKVNANEAEQKRSNKIEVRSTVDYSENIWQISPSRNTQLITVSNPAKERTYVQVIDESGKLINVQTSREGSFDVRLQKLQPGTYLLSLKSAVALEEYKLVID